MRSLLFGNNKWLGEDQLLAYGGVLGLDPAAYRESLSSVRHLDQIDADSRTAAGVGLTGTPSLVVAKSDGDTVEGRTIIGVQPLTVLTSAIDPLVEPEGPGTSRG